MNPSNAVKIYEPTDTVEVGANGYRVGYLKNGDKVEWLPGDETLREENPMILLRNDSAIREAYQEFWDKVWWSRNVVRLQRIASAHESLSETQLEALYPGNTVLKRIETKYGRENLDWTDFEWGLLCGRMSALSWIRGAEWDESLDT